MTSYIIMSVHGKTFRPLATM